MSTSTTYRYPHFELGLLFEDRSFQGGARPGEPMPDFDLPTTSGGRARKADYVGNRPLLLALGSFTCPMTADAGSALKRLHAEFGDRVGFLTIYVREAHPGERYPQPDTFEQKFSNARDYQARDNIPWTVAVDDIDGTVHRELDSKPSAAYLMGMDGNVAQRVLWANDYRELRKAIESVLSGKPVQQRERLNRLLPMLRGTAHMYDVLGLAGNQAREDVRRQIPPMYAMARLASAFRPLPPLGRTVAATAVVGLGIAAAAGGTWWLLRRKR